jgi:hypothetical protein
MKKIKITYWTSTILISVFMTYSAYSYLTEPAIAEAFRYMGFPSYFRIELAFAKIIGAIVLLLPLSRKIKEWAYAGFAIVFISAFISHTASGHPVSVSLMPVVFLAILVVSYLSFNKLELWRKEYGSTKLMVHPHHESSMLTH